MKKDNEEKVRANQAEFLDALLKKDRPYTIQVQGIDIIVNPGVFPPATDTVLLSKHIHVNDSHRILDLTTGSGALAVVAGVQGASGLGVDINPEAVQNANENFQRLGLKMKAVEGDLFAPIPLEQFDFIYSNGPYIEGTINHPLEHAFYGTKKYIDGLFTNAGQYLKEKGVMLVAYAAWGNVSYFENAAQNNKFDFEVIDSLTSNDKERTYHLYSFSKK